MSDNRINIPSTIKDANYRYRMPRMILRIEGGGNGIMTNITNLAKVAEALAVPTECTTELIHRHPQVLHVRPKHDGPLP
jgi:hypothetical protein